MLELTNKIIGLSANLTEKAEFSFKLGSVFERRDEEVMSINFLCLNPISCEFASVIFCLFLLK